TLAPMHFKRACALWLTLVASCAGRIASPETLRSTETSFAQWSGSLSFEARLPTSSGLSQQGELRPVRLARLQVLSPQGEVVTESTTDKHGTFQIRAPVDASTLRILAMVVHDRYDLRVTTDRTGEEVHTIDVPLGSPEKMIAIEIRDPMPMAGALHILDTLLRGSEQVRSWSGEVLAPLFVYWQRGETTTWSYYHGECPPESGRYCIELLGGSDGELERSDTDEHDEFIILHELGHFVFDLLSTSSSHGGTHPAGHLLDPGLCWEEGRATWFATAVLGSSRYRDTVGVEGHGRLRVDHNIEDASKVGSALGSEPVVSEVLWDLSDGGVHLPDEDGDPLAVGPQRLFQAMMLQRRVEGAYPTIHSFLRFLIDREFVSEDELQRMISVGAHPPDLLSSSHENLWPRSLSVPGRVSGKIDGVSDPAPSGGPNRPQNGLDAMMVYRFQWNATGRILLRLRTFGSGSAADRQDLDLELRDIRSDLLAASRSQAPVEAVSAVLEPGWYLVYVRDGGSGNRAGFELELRRSRLTAHAP
ncbi:MAG: hypothetical protein AAF550_11375, partial [Myxococcota bacterium]